MGIIEKSQHGYRLSNRSSAIPSMAPTSKGKEYVQLLQTYIPVNVKTNEIVRQLIGKWFKNLRWLGMIDSGTGYTLQWSSDDGSFQINLRIVSDYVVIETNAFNEKEKLQAMIGSYAVYEQIVRIMQSKFPETFILDHQQHQKIIYERNNN